MPRGLKLQPFRDEIESQFSQDVPISDIHSSINAQLANSGVQPVCLRTFERMLVAWGQTRYTSSEGLEPFREEIYRLYNDGMTIGDIHVQLNDWLEEQGKDPVGKRTLESKLCVWGLNSRRKNVAITDELVERVKYYFFKEKLSDPMILRELKLRDGLEASPCAIRHIRYNHGMQRRIRTSLKEKAQ